MMTKRELLINRMDITEQEFNALGLTGEDINELTKGYFSEDTQGLNHFIQEPWKN